MLDSSRFQKHKPYQLTAILRLIFDVSSSIILLIPILFVAIFRNIYCRRKSVQGKLALVTGSGNGLGRAICLELAGLGCNIAVVDIDMNSAEKTVDVIKCADMKAIAYQVDITKQNDVLKLCDDVCKDFGAVDILINNAGLMSLLNMNENLEFIETMIKVNVFGTILMTNIFLEQMKKQSSGHIVSISSMAGLHASPFSVPYTATKYAVSGFMRGLTEHLRLEKFDSKIKTTCVFPYYIKTRQDIIDYLSPIIRFPPLEITGAAHQVVEAILRQDNTISIPKLLKPLTKLMEILPLCAQQMMRDRVLHEYESQSNSNY